MLIQKQSCKATYGVLLFVGTVNVRPRDTVAATPTDESDANGDDADRTGLEGSMGVGSFVEQLQQHIQAFQ